MAYLRDYVQEQLTYIKSVLGEQFDSKITYEQIKENILKNISEEDLDKLNNAVITISLNGSNTCSLRCKGILLKSCEFSEISWYRECFDQYVLETDNIDDAIELFRDDFPVNDNIVKGTAKGRIRSKFNELKLEADNYGFNLEDFICQDKGGD
ncbi:hypothetical protein [uncultured Methanobrevibacter sp.]|uniref:hypothetical protein n=1 Tax=uncultured Methanobrevibacter sp. TaxID=253161 RepID=UPI0025F4643C|nr:hypothetical protein [uncultured Methanobrevibacter sp.]